MRMTVVRALLWLPLCLYGCGGGDGEGPATPTTLPHATTTTTASTTTTTLPPAGANVERIYVDSGPTSQYVNGIFTSVTVCVPGSDTACQRVDDVLVDTGSSGLRILSSALSLQLPQETGPQGNTLAECFSFVSGTTWGPVQLADIKIAGERASSVSIQVIGHPDFSRIPEECSDRGPVRNTFDDLMANGILGVGLFRQDCGSQCSTTRDSAMYYECASSTCTQTTLEISRQVQNPVWLFPVDNNGVLIDLPSVEPSGAASVQGSLIFGIGTRSNNGLGSARVLATDQFGTFTTFFDGRGYNGSFIDSGSNGLFFLDTALSGIPTCRTYSDWYCPSATLTLSATNRGTNGASSTVQFSVANAESLFSQDASSAFSNLAGPFGLRLFDWGLPFFFGRRIYTAIESQNTPAGPGPYWAY